MQSEIWTRRSVRRAARGRTTCNISSGPVLLDTQIATQALRTELPGLLKTNMSRASGVASKRSTKTEYIETVSKLEAELRRVASISDLTTGHWQQDLAPSLH